jgi:archaemetzincin
MPGEIKNIASDTNSDISSYIVESNFDSKLSASGLFKPLPEPEPDYWLANHHEKGQTFDEFLTAPRNILDTVRRYIYIQPLWNFSRSKSPSLELLRQYTESYFTIPVKLLGVDKPLQNQFFPRINANSRNRQLHAGMILSYMLQHIPDDAYCVIGVTMEDLYPDSSWNFVFGYASYIDRVGVFSFCRFDQSFYSENDTTDHKLLLMRSCKVLTHETGHMFGMNHCIAYHCNMNGSNNLQESDAQPASMCPVCLRKLQYVTGFNIVSRFEMLKKFYDSNGYIYEYAWVNLMLEYLQ